MIVKCTLFQKTISFMACFGRFTCPSKTWENEQPASVCGQQCLGRLQWRCRAVLEDKSPDGSDKLFCKEIIPKFNTWKVCFLERKTAHESKKNVHFGQVGRTCFSKWPSLHFKMGHSARQNEPFSLSKWAIFACKTAHFARLEYVKKIQGVGFQWFEKTANFAYFGPSSKKFWAWPFLRTAL